MRSQENDIVSATKVIIETNVASKRYCNYYERIIKKDSNNSPLHNMKNFRANCDIDEFTGGRFPLTI